jgi:hypothetical protein
MSDAMTITDQIIKSNKTSRSAGAIGANAIVPKWIADSCESKEVKILDFGAGKYMQHVHKLRELGYVNVAGYEFGLNITDSHMIALRPQFFDVIYASNVFNTHSSALMSAEALHLIRSSLRIRGHFVFNMPKSPNYFWTNTDDFIRLVQGVFGIYPAKVDSRGIYMVKRDLYAEKYLLT